MNILEINELNKFYGANHALKDFTINVPERSVFGILGPNGSGKTTILSIILGIIKANQGTFQWKGFSENCVPNNIGALIETPNFYPYLSLHRNLQIIAEIKQISFVHIDEVLQKLGLLERKYSKYLTLSLGMKQKMGLAAAFIGNPGILVLDEPTNGLDPEGIANVRNIILEEVKIGKTIIMASHILNEVQKVCTDIVILKKGEVLKTTSINELIDSKVKLIISANELQKLFELIVKSGLSENVEMKGNDLILELAKNIEPKDINEFAFKHGIILNKFKEEISSLEDEFLQIIK